MLGRINKYFIIASIVGICVNTYHASAQNFKEFTDPMAGVVYKVHVQYSDSIVEAFYYRGDKKIKTEDNLFYYWYAAQDIKKTRGAYEGKLLHGKYTMYYYNKDLLRKGEFNYGLKNGQWLSWYQGGEVKSKEKWKNGVLVGTAFYYHPNGKLKSHRKFIDKVGSGHEADYDAQGNLISKKHYKGKELINQVDYHQNEKGKAVVTKPEKVKKSKKGKNIKDKDAPKVKKEKGKQPKIKIQKFREVVPGGIGA